MEKLKILPFTRKCSSTVRVPGSKSISNRALILATLSKAKVTLRGMLQSEDVQLMKEALHSLGVQIEESGQDNELIVTGCGGILPVQKQNIFVGNAGTVARFLTAVLAIQRNGEFHLDGTEAMRARPMLELIKTLEVLGCTFTFLESPGCFPFIMKTQGIKSSEWRVDATKSSQVLSALLMIAPVINQKTSIQYSGGTVSEPFVDLTLEMMEAFSTGPTRIAKNQEYCISVDSRGYTSSNFNYDIEPDATAASYFLTLPIASGGKCKVSGIYRKMSQGDSKFSGILENIGITINEDEIGTTSTLAGKLKGGTFDFNAISDTFLSLAAISPILPEPIKITGIKHTRKQETDRVKAMASELLKLDQKVIEKEDSLEVFPSLKNLKNKTRSGISIDTYHDHRIAMSFGILGCFDLFENGNPWLTINDPMCCSKTFPDFFQRLKFLYDESHQ